MLRLTWFHYWKGPASLVEMTRKLFRQLATAAWLLDEQDQLLEETLTGETLRLLYQIDLQKILEISRGQGCSLHATQRDCLECPVEHIRSEERFPVELLDRQGNQRLLWGSVQREAEYTLVQLKEDDTLVSENRDHSLFDYLNDARELERKRIAQDLHDGIAQSIYSLMLETRLLKWLEPTDQKAKLLEIDQHFAEVLREVKDLSSELRPMSLDEFGLVPALEQFIKRTMEMTGFEIDLEVKGTERPLTENQRTAIYRSVQESIANALKYSGVNQAVITVAFSDQLEITVKDEGAGFDRQTITGGFGLLNLQERIQALGGKITILSVPEKGTAITMVVPYEGGGHS